MQMLAERSGEPKQAMLSEGLVARAGELMSEPKSLEASLVKTAKRFEDDALAATMLRGVARPAGPPADLS